MTDPFDSDSPLIAAPMAGGPSTPALVAAAASAHAFGFLAAGNLGAEAMSERIAETRSLTPLFGVNVFAPDPRGTISAGDYRRYRGALLPLADELAATLPETIADDDDEFDAKIDVLLADPVPAVSFTFALPPVAVVRLLRRAGSRVAVTVTTPGEARAAADLGVDALIVQGPSAGGHSATFDIDRAITDASTESVLAAVARVTALPLIAAGGVDSPAAVSRLLAAGADRVQVGTVLLRTPEAGTNDTHRAALADPRFTSTAVTRAFTGRPARSLRNAFVDEFDRVAPAGYPAIHRLTQDLRRVASLRGDAEHLNLWAGTGFRAAREAPAVEVLTELAGAA